MTIVLLLLAVALAGSIYARKRKAAGKPIVPFLGGTRPKDPDDRPNQSQF